VITLTEESQRILLSLSKPLSPIAREQFFRQVASTLAELSEIGPGTVYQVAAAVQRALFDAPLLDGSSED
jgi:hypothetical protein